MSGPRCPVCFKEDAQIHPIFKILPGLRCQSRMAAQSSPDKMVEFTTQEIKSQRKEYARSIIQPYRSGQLSKEYLEQYGTQGIRATPEEIKNAKKVWSEDWNENFDLKKTK